MLLHELKGKTMSLQSRQSLLLSLLSGAVVIYFGCYYYFNHSKPQIFLPATISTEVFANAEVMKEYNNCFVLQNNATSLELQQCRQLASKSWFVGEREDLNCYLAQAKAVESACEPIIAEFRKK